jgi:hypothetical protein
MEMLQGFPMDDELEKAVDECLEMARDAAKAHGIETAPERPKSAREAYGRFSKYVADRQRMAAFIRDRVEPWRKEMRAILDFELPDIASETYHRSPAMIRAETAYGAAALIEAGGEHLEQGLSLANTVLDAVGEEGNLYSTLDSVAAITLLSALKRSRMGTLNGGSCLVDDERISTSDATKRNGDTRCIEAIDGTLQVEVTRVVEEDYTALDSGIGARISLERRGRRVNGPLAPGDAVDLVLDVQDDYEPGDLVHLFLPDALSWVHGGGQVKRFSLDLEGQTTLRIPLAATGLTLSETGDVAPQHFAVCLRNMYDEERGKGFGDIAVTVAHESEGPSGLAQKVWRGLKSML